MDITTLYPDHIGLRRPLQYRHGMAVPFGQIWGQRYNHAVEGMPQTCLTASKSSHNAHGMSKARPRHVHGTPTASTAWSQPPKKYSWNTTMLEMPWGCHGRTVSIVTAFRCRTACLLHPLCCLVAPQPQICPNGADLPYRCRRGCRKAMRSGY